MRSTESLFKSHLVADRSLCVVGDLRHDVLPTLHRGRNWTTVRRFGLGEVGGCVSINFLLDSMLLLLLLLLPSLLLLLVPSLLLPNLMTSPATRLQSDLHPAAGVEVGIVDDGMAHQVGGGACAVPGRCGSRGGIDQRPRL